MSNFEEDSFIPTSVVLARTAGELVEISMGDENASPKLVIYTTGEPMTGKAVEALRRSRQLRRGLLLSRKKSTTWSKGRSLKQLPRSGTSCGRNS